MGTLRGRLGYAFGPFLPHVTGGLAYGRSKLDIVTVPDGNDLRQSPLASRLDGRVLASKWRSTARGAPGSKYSDTDPGNQTHRVGGIAFPTVRPQVHAVKFGLNSPIRRHQYAAGRNLPN